MASSVFDEVRAAVATLERVVRDLEPGILDGPGAVRLVELFARGEHVCAAGKADATKRVDATGAYRAHGHASAAQWLASASGVSVGAATQSLRTAEALDALPATATEFRAGRLSAAQASEIAAAATADPSAEATLLRTAHRQTLKGLKDRCRRVVAGTIDDDAAWARELHEQRALSRWHEHRGVARMDVRFSPAAAAQVFAALDAETDRLFRVTRAAGNRVPRTALMHDALVELVLHGPRRPVDVRVDVGARSLDAGHVVEGERCELPGVGPVPVTVARAMLADAAVTVLVHDDDDAITHVSSRTRTIPTKLRRWLEATYPVCGRKGCDNDRGLVIDHIEDFARGGPADVHNTWRLCAICHDLKTYCGWRVVGHPGAWDLVPPDDPDPPVGGARVDGEGHDGTAERSPDVGVSGCGATARAP